MLIDYSGLTTHWQLSLHGICPTFSSSPLARGILPLALSHCIVMIKKIHKKKVERYSSFYRDNNLREVNSFCCLFFLKLQRKDNTLIVNPVSFRDGSANSSVQNSGQFKCHLCLFGFIQQVVPNTALTFLRWLCWRQHGRDHTVCPL